MSPDRTCQSSPSQYRYAEQSANYWIADDTAGLSVGVMRSLVARRMTWLSLGPTWILRADGPAARRASLRGER